MADEYVENLEAREAINQTLKDILSTDGWGKSHWDRVVKNLNEEFGIETDLLELAQYAPGLVEMFQIGALAHKGIIGKEIRAILRQIVYMLGRIAVNAEQGNEKASNQLKALHKLAYPNNYELPATVIKTLADSYHTSPHLARAWSIRSLMLDLSYVVESSRRDRSMLECSVKLTTTNARLHPKMYEKAAKHIKKNSTLQSLAIDIYIEQLENEGISIDPRQLKRDLQKLKAWESRGLLESSSGLPLWDNDRFPPETLPPIPIYSEGWKLRWKRGDKK